MSTFHSSNMFANTILIWEIGKIEHHHARTFSVRSIHLSIHFDYYLLFHYKYFIKIFFQRFWRRSLVMKSTIKWISKEKKCMWPYCSFRSYLCTSKSANRSFRVCVWVTTIKSPFKFHKLLCQHFMKCPKKTGQFEEFKYFFSV